MSYRPARLSGSLPLFTGLLAAAALGLALGLGRVLSETFYHSLGWLAAWPGTLASALLAGGVLLLLWRRLISRHSGGAAGAALAFLPLLLPLLYVACEPVNLLQGHSLLWGGLLLAALLQLRGVLPAAQSGRLTGAALVVGILAVYLATLGSTVGRADTFEFQVVAYKLGIAHPTGYPLYLLLGKLATLLPVGSIAWRVNLVSALCATAAGWLVFATLRRLLPARSADLIALLAVWALAFSPTLWSQAVEAEVYALNVLLVAWVFWLLTLPLVTRSQQLLARRLPWLGLVLGLGLANHLTTAILLAPVAVALLLLRPRAGGRRWLAAGLLLGAGLALYLYLPLRWPAVNDGQLLSLPQFVDWVIGGRFKGALQLSAWRHDLTRYAIVGRLILAPWGWPGVLLAGLGVLWLLLRRWRVALVLLAAWLGYAYYALSYYVPDISVFFIPAQLVMVFWLACGAAGVLEAADRWLPRRWAGIRPLLAPLAVVLLALLPLHLLESNWSAVDRSGSSPLESWGRQVLNLGLVPGAAILADSEKIAPLYYLQQVEGLRPDLEIVVLPDEAAYRAQLDARVAAGQTVYLARFLPGLEGVYHLSSLGPLLHVSATPRTELPPLDRELNLRFGPHVILLGYQLPAEPLVYPETSLLTLYWTSDAPVDGIYKVWLRLLDAAGEPLWTSDGAHPAGDDYPTFAWRPGEIVTDAHSLAAPAYLAAGDYELQVALRMPFGETGLTPAQQADLWATIGRVQVAAPAELPAPDRPLRIWTGGGAVVGLDVAASARPQAELPVTLLLDGAATGLRVGWNEADAGLLPGTLPVVRLVLVAPAEDGVHTLYLWGDAPLRCGWLHSASASCALASVRVEGASLPAGAWNFGERVALLAVDMADMSMQPGSTLDLTLHWQALAHMEADYTMFAHVLDAADHIVGQVDSWPVQGTFPTSQWVAGELVTDSVRIAIDPAAAPGLYRLEMGWYLLGTMQRLPVLDADGEPIDDRVLLDGLLIPDLAD